MKDFKLKNILTAAVSVFAMSTFAAQAQIGSSTSSNPSNANNTPSSTRNYSTPDNSSMPAPNSVESTSPTQTGGLPMALPQQVDRNNQITLDQNQRQAQRSFQNLEVCRDDDAACIRRRNEQMRRNTPFQQQTPPVPGMTTPPDSNIRQ